MKDYRVYNYDKSLYAVAIGRVLTRYVRPFTKYVRSEIVRIGQPIKFSSFEEAKSGADMWVNGRLL